MKIYKFGGASIKDVEGIKNVGNILKQNSLSEAVIVVSAMGKMTNAFEKVVEAVIQSTDLTPSLNFIKNYHYEVVEDLFDEDTATKRHVAQLFLHLEQEISTLKTDNYDFVYDQIVSYGELLSTTIVSDYLNTIGIKNRWLDARNLIKTDNTFRDAKVNWKLSQERIQEDIQSNQVYLVQGFLGGTTEGDTTTLGREGSDYTAGIFAYCLDAEDVVIWKDVAGVMNADPRVFSKTTVLNEISYEETIEMAFYGASVVHPKTIQPLKRKRIPLFVKSFLNPHKTGTKVSNGMSLNPNVPCYILKKNQILVSIASKDFSFIVEDNVRQIFQWLHEYQLNVSLIQNSAISFSVCLDNKFRKFDQFLDKIKVAFDVEYHENVDLYTIRHFTPEAVKEIESKGVRLLRQTTQETTQIVIASDS